MQSERLKMSSQVISLQTELQLVKYELEGKQLRESLAYPTVISPSSQGQLQSQQTVQARASGSARLYVLLFESACAFVL